MLAFLPVVQSSRGEPRPGPPLPPPISGPLVTFYFVTDPASFSLPLGTQSLSWPRLVVDYAQCLPRFLWKLWARKSWGSCIAPWENPSSDCWGSVPSPRALSCLRRKAGDWFPCMVPFGTPVPALGGDWFVSVCAGGRGTVGVCD
jgi:hypothetical protein